jgi:hypothetical protein
MLVQQHGNGVVPDHVLRSAFELDAVRNDEQRLSYEEPTQKFNNSFIHQLDL